MGVGFDLIKLVPVVGSPKSWLQPAAVKVSRPIQKRRRISPQKQSSAPQSPILRAHLSFIEKPEATFLRGVGARLPSMNVSPFAHSN
jgi:hypothetical protein